jgi:hypothetical protein
VPCEDPAVAAKNREQRTTYLVGGLGCAGLGGVILWSLGALNNQAARRARQREAMRDYPAPDWRFENPVDAPSSSSTREQA